MRAGIAGLLALAAILPGCALFEGDSRFILVEDSFRFESPNMLDADMGPHCAAATFTLDPPGLVFRTPQRTILRAPSLMIVRYFSPTGPATTVSADRTELYTSTPAELRAPLDRSLVLVNLSLEGDRVLANGTELGPDATLQRTYEAGGASVNETMRIRDFGFVPASVRYVGGCD